MCDTRVEGESVEDFGDRWVAHCAIAHDDVPYPEANIRAFGEGLARMTGGAERLASIDEVDVHPVTVDRIDDWLDLFDHHVMVGKPENASCYCLEAHELGSDGPHIEYTDWRARRAAMAERLRAGTTFGYLAYVDGQPAGWINASKRADYAMHRRNDDADATTVGIACFAIAPPYRKHGLAQALLDRVVADATSRGATAVEAYPFNGDDGAGSGFRGGRAMYDASGFTEVKVRQRDTVVRRAV